MTRLRTNGADSSSGGAGKPGKDEMQADAPIHDPPSESRMFRSHKSDVPALSGGNSTSRQVHGVGALGGGGECVGVSSEFGDVTQSVASACAA